LVGDRFGLPLSGGRGWSRTSCCCPCHRAGGHV